MVTQPSPEGQRLSYIDALRGIAALMVLWFHVVQQGFSAKAPHWFMTLSSQGARGVQLFYVLSALTLFLTLDSRKQKGERNVFGFFVRRFFRIAPLFYCACIFFRLLYGASPRYLHGQIIDTKVWLTNIFFVNGLSPYLIHSIVPVGWSVTVEVLFYLTVPALFLYLTSLRRAVCFVGCALILSLGVFYFLSAHPLINDRRLWREFLALWVVNQFPVFALGFVVYYFLRGGWFARCAQQTVETNYFGRLLTLFSLLGAVALAYWESPPLPRHFLYGLLFSLLIIGLALRPETLLVNRFTIFIGKISYSVYLTHIACLHYVLGWARTKPFFAQLTPLWGSLLLFFATALITLVCSFVTWRVIEVPGQALGRRLLKWRQAL